MGDWEDRLSAHPVQARVREFEQVLAGVPRDENNAESLERAAAVAEYAKGVLAVLDPYLVRHEALDGVEGAFREGSMLLVNYTAIPDAEDLAALHQHLDRALQALQSTPIPTSPDLERLREAAVRYQQSVTQRANAVDRNADELGKELEDLRAQVEQYGQGIEAKAKEAEDRITAEFAPVDSRVKALVQTSETATSRLDQSIANYQTTFQSEQATRNQEWQETSAKAREDIEKLLQASNESLETNIETQQQTASETLQAMEEHRDEARRLVSRTASLTVAGGYLNYANGERIVKYIWQVIGVAVLMVVAAYGYQALGETRPASISLEWLAGRLLVALPLVGLSLLAFSFASRAGRNEREARSLEMDLRALDPYIELLDDDVKRDLKVELAKRAFFRGEAQAQATDLMTPKELLERSFDLAKEAIKKS